MKLTIERSALFRSLQHVQSVVERRNTIPILSNLLVSADGGRLGLTATDLDIAVVDGTEAEVAQSGATTAPAHLLYEIVRKLPDGAQVELTLAEEGDRMTLRAGRSEFSILCLPAADFPAMTEGELPTSFDIPAGTLLELIDKTRFAVSTEETRYYLNGIFVHTVAGGDGTVLRAVATDGHRLARFETAVPAGADGMPGVILPRKTIGELHKLLDGAEGDVHVALSDTKVRFALDSIVLTSKLIDGTFPDYERVIPSGNDKHLVVHRKTFMEAVDRVSTIASDKSRAVKLSLDSGRLVLSATSPEHASATEELAVEYDAEPLEIGFNSRYVLEMVQQMAGDSAEFLIADASSPTVVRDGDDTAALYVLMPMRV